MSYLQKLSVTLATMLTLATLNANAQQSSSPGTLSSLAGLSGTSKPANRAEMRYAHSTVRLLPGTYKNGAWLAGVEIALAPGWKTYWRVPGDAGVPAEFVWDKSKNLKQATVMWPAPKRFEDVTGKSIGYKKQVVFPVKIAAKVPGQPVDVALNLYYAACSDICVPASANLALRLNRDDTASASASLIRKFAKTVPSKAAAGVAVSHLKAISVNGKPVLEVVMKGLVDRNTDILVEGFEGAYFDQPKMVGMKDGNRIFHLSIAGLEKGDTLRSQKLKLTVLAGNIRLVSEGRVE